MLSKMAVLKSASSNSLEKGHVSGHDKGKGKASYISHFLVYYIIPPIVIVLLQHDVCNEQ
jgi:hypothetical protein